MLPSPIVSLSGYASLNMEHLLPHDTINSTVRSEDGTHGIVELTFGAPVPSRSSLAGNGISITGTNGWIWVDQTKITNPFGDEENVFRITIKAVVRNKDGEDVGETEDVIHERVRGVELELRSFFQAIGGTDDGFGSPLEALKDVAFIQAALNSDGNPVDLVALVKG